MPLSSLKKDMEAVKTKVFYSSFSLLCALPCPLALTSDPKIAAI